MLDVDSNVTIAVDTVSAMDVSVANSAVSGVDAGNLFETLEKIEQGNDGVNAFVPDEDLSLADLMGLIGEGDEANKVELEVAEVVIKTTDAEVAEDNLNVKCESNSEGANGEHDSSDVVAPDDSPKVDSANDSVVTIDNSVEIVKAADTPPESGKSEDGASDGAKIGTKDGYTGATFSPIHTIPKYRLREIFKHANGNLFLLYVAYNLS